jgi:hypothetical protein
MPDTMLRAFGWSPLLIHGGPCVLDRWLWLRRRLGRGNALVLPLRPLVLPLRALVVLDRPLSRALRYPYLSVPLSGVKRA